MVTDLPFKLSASTIVIVKKVPVLQCRNCTEYLIEDAPFARVEEMLSGVDQGAELEVIQYAA
jgi:YgiT-type zinc finger domain-containing protein